MRAALDAGMKVNAVKIYRDETGASLADAVRYVDTMEQHRQGRPLGL
jgi:ribosomal protein L7/L12